ncbi:hypothetical protein R70006_04954 [Paraburkholderia domus]|uniref:hypothetical protein n=1 Tax=Paraburkholderia domus TaxID=2793075 RepID=UPI0019116A17|nr:hypothetical protein [Paraburkholderia domus]MBK5051810.1 hypothetical protein [Burkholderia sp. R-70006]CAE6793383.1 hypothetical protein R70006_04954 [Paraburkholderia domus]
MQLSERHSLAQKVVSLLGTAAPEFGPNVMGPVVATRLCAAIAAVDALVLSTESPVLLADLLPGVDVIGVRDYTRPAKGDLPDGPFFTGDWEEGSLDHRVLDELGQMAVAYLAKEAAGTRGAGALSHSGSDGIHYFMFESRYREMALRQIGLTEKEVQLVESGATAGV